MNNYLVIGRIIYVNTITSSSFEILLNLTTFCDLGNLEFDTPITEVASPVRDRFYSEPTDEQYFKNSASIESQS